MERRQASPRKGLRERLRRKYLKDRGVDCFERNFPGLRDQHPESESPQRRGIREVEI